MNHSHPRSKNFITWFLVIPALAWFYIGLFVTMFLWYPHGLTTSQWQAHILNFSIVYALWLIVFYSYRLFDWDTFRVGFGYLGKLVSVLLICTLIAVVYFYLQPNLLITPRRFLLIHILVSGFGISIWFWLMRYANNLIPKKQIYTFRTSTYFDQTKELVSNHNYLGMEFSGSFEAGQVQPIGSIVIIPDKSELTTEIEQALFTLRNQGVKFVDFYELHENITRTIHLSRLSDLWFIHSVDYGAHQFSDIIKRGLDLVLGLLGFLVFIVTFPVVAVLIKLSSIGPIFFTQSRVGLNGTTFTLFKYRTMRLGTDTNTWTAAQDSRITSIGQFLRATRLDELPQSINILKGDMSIVGPRPEQVNIVAEMREQIPYYDERHIVKPGLTGWAQLHVYAATVEETKRKLQYDLYYIKHRSLLFDIEIILKTAYNIFTLKGR